MSTLTVHEIVNAGHEMARVSGEIDDVLDSSTLSQLHQMLVLETLCFRMKYMMIRKP